MDAGVSAGFDFQSWAAEQGARVERALSAWVAEDAPAGLGEAMRYAVLDGGKRLRPLLVLAASESVSEGVAQAGRTAIDQAALRAACAVELIHAYSLVHDDMPCMDNDVLRRGKPTVHVQYGEALALLAGDALQALAFELLTPDEACSVPPFRRGCAGCWRVRPDTKAWRGGRPSTWPVWARRSRRISCARCTGSRPERCCAAA
jgi:farnesyl diphosphate synthase